MDKEYISREAALLEACKGCSIDFPCEPCEPQNCEIKARLDAIPAADVVEVVRCRECIFRDHYKELDGTKICICTGAMAYTCTPDDWYCANGKRKDGGKDDD